MRFFERMRDAVVVARRAEGDAPLLPPSRAAASRLVTADQALTLSSVYRSFEILAVAVSQLSCGVWRQGVEIETPSLVVKPDLNMPRAAFFEQTTTSLASTGNAFWRKHRTGPADPVISLEVMPSHEVAVTRAATGTTPAEYAWKGEPLKAWQVQHLQKMRVPGRLYGLGPIEACRAELRGSIDLRDYAAEWFDQSGIPNGTLNTEQKLTPEQAKAWKAQAQDLFKPTEIAVLGQGLEYKPVALRPADAQFLESRQFSVTEVARMFGIPAKYLLAVVEGSSDTYSNQEQVDIWFVRYTLMSYLREIEMALTDVLPRGQEVRFKVDGLLRTDTKTRYEAHEIALRSGLYSAHYAQEIEGLPRYTKPATPAPAPTPAEEPADA